MYLVYLLQKAVGTRTLTLRQLQTAKDAALRAVLAGWKFCACSRRQSAQNLNVVMVMVTGTRGWTAGVKESQAPQ